MQYLKNLTLTEWLQIISAALTIILGVLTSLTKLVKEDGRRTLKGNLLIFFLCLSAVFSLAATIVQSNQNHIEELLASQKALRDSSIRQGQYEDLARKSGDELDTASKTLSGVKRSINSLDDLQIRSNRIISKLATELVIQKQINISTQNLLSQNIQISKRADSIILSLERIQDPLFPANFYLSVTVPIKDDQTKILADTLRKIWNKYNTGKTSHKDPIGIVTREDEINIFNYDTLLKSINFDFISKKEFYIGITSDSLPLQGDRLLYVKASYSGNFMNESMPLKKKVCKLTYNFKENRLKFEMILTNYYSESGKPVLFLSLRDLVGYYLCVSPGGGEYKIEDFAFIFGTKVLRSIQFRNNYGSTIEGVENLLIHKILPDDLKLVFIDWTSYFLEYR